jgi:RNA polymerase sigma-70 factor (ECF subfamily)
VRALEDLPHEQREVFLMREIAKLPFDDIALITHCSTDTVKSRMRYALERLRDALSNFEEYARALR